MVQDSGGSRFLLEAPEAVGIARERRGQDLDRDLPSEAVVARPIDLPHPSGADLAEDLVRAEAGTGRERQALLPFAGIYLGRRSSVI
jgi:hypothetical protein